MLVNHVELPITEQQQRLLSNLLMGTCIQHAYTVKGYQRILIVQDKDVPRLQAALADGRAILISASEMLEKLSQHNEIKAQQDSPYQGRAPTSS